MPGAELRFVGNGDQVLARAIYPQFDSSCADDEGMLEIELLNEYAGIKIDSCTAISLWSGEWMDCDLALAGLWKVGAQRPGLM